MGSRSEQNGRDRGRGGLGEGRSSSVGVCIATEATVAAGGIGSRGGVPSVSGRRIGSGFGRFIPRRSSGGRSGWWGRWRPSSWKSSPGNSSSPVKTTSPKNYCVRPNVGVLLPKTSCEFTVTMQAQKIAPPDLQCRDKFLVQSIVVPFGTTEKDLNPNLFSKENGRFIEENKLRVVLISQPHSVLQPINGALNQGPAEFIVSKETPLSKGSPCLREVPVSQESPLSEETHKPRDQGTNAPGDAPSALEVLHPSYVVRNGDVQNLRAKLLQLDSKLIETEKSITKLLDEKSSTIQEKEKLQQEVVLLRRKCAAGVRVGFPLLFVCFVALVGMMLGHLIHP